MILIGSGSHAKVGGGSSEKQEMRAAAEALPFLWRHTNWSRWSLLLRVPRWMYRGYSRHNAGDLAASMAYHGLIAMVPIFFLMVGVGGLFLRNESVMAQAVKLIRVIFPEGSGSIEAFRAAVDARDSSGIVSVLSFLTFSWVGTGWISSMSRGMNKIYGVRNPSFIAEKQRGFMVILLLLTFFIASVLSAIVPTVILLVDLPEIVDRAFLESWVSRLTAYGVALASTVGLFLVIYRIVPNARQTTLDVWPGTLTATLLFLLLTQAFPFYIQWVGGVNRYGKLLGLISLIVVVLFFLSHVILFGAYINATWQRRRARRLQRRRIERAQRDDGVATRSELERLEREDIEMSL